MIRRTIQSIVILTVTFGHVAQGQRSDPEPTSAAKTQSVRDRSGVPAGQYSPLAAQGGYAKGRQSPFEVVVRAMNPRNVNFGELWEQRRRMWLDNAGANRYFWYSFAATAILVLSWFSLAWMYTDRVRERWQLADHTAEALRYAEYCKRRAGEAISRYNEHIEKCNRVIEAGESGMATPETASLADYRRQIEQLTADNDAKALKLARAEEELQKKSKELIAVTARISEVERVVANKREPVNPEATAALADRIRRLEEENRTVKEENRKLRQQQRSAKAPEVPNPQETAQC